jgi:hypothetical protein
LLTKIAHTGMDEPVEPYLPSTSMTSSRAASVCLIPSCMHRRSTIGGMVSCDHPCR